MTIAKLADEYGTLAAQIKALQAKQSAVKKQLETYKSDVLVGETYTVKKSSYEQSRLDTAAIKADMGETWIASYSKVVTGTRYTVSLSAVDIEAV